MKVGRWSFALAVAIALWPALPTRAQSPELMDSYRQYKALRGQGDYAAAVPFAKKALRLGEREFGPDHETTASLLNNLAGVYKAQGRYCTDTDIGFTKTSCRAILRPWRKTYV